MAALTLPDGVVPYDMEAWFVDAGIWQRGPAGGVDIRVDRGGSRYGAKLLFRPVESRAVGRIVVSRLIRAQRLGLRVKLPVGDFDAGVPGAPKVDGNGQAGTSLAAKGFTPNYSSVEGQWFNHVRGDDAKLYNLATGVIADASGDATLTIEPELGIEPLDDDVLLFGQPVIQGRPVGSEARWRLSIERLNWFEIEIVEKI